MVRPRRRARTAIWRGAAHAHAPLLSPQPPLFCVAKLTQTISPAPRHLAACHGTSRRTRRNRACPVSYCGMHCEGGKGKWVRENAIQVAGAIARSCVDRKVAKRLGGKRAARPCQRPKRRARTKANSWYGGCGPRGPGRPGAGPGAHGRRSRRRMRRTPSAPPST